MLNGIAGDSTSLGRSFAVARPVAPLKKFSELPAPTSLDSPVHYRGVGPMSSWLILLFIAITLIAVVLDLGKR
ncbi:hypothetical protein ACQCLI_22885 [Pseudomonas nitroreducens]|uniref:hypothetical protein n=1 Tax=Pseudomonas nitroreducens TaxID=46680 RepID=UPI0012FD3307|nr:hypothetical protein [Pseudomonas nitroreducens]